MVDQGASVAVNFGERELWAIRNWCADVALSSQIVLHPEAVMSLVSEQEASLIESLRNGDRISAHLIYADWLDEREMGIAAIGHRLAVEGFQWRYVGSQVVFLRGHIFGMYNAFQGFLSPDKRDSSDRVGTWLVPLDETNGAFAGPKIPHAEYVGSFSFKTVIEKIYQVSWQLRDVRLNQKEPTA